MATDIENGQEPEIQTPRRASVIDSLIESGRRSSLGQALEEASSKIKEVSSKLAEKTESIFSGETIKQWVDFIKLHVDLKFDAQACLNKG